MLQQNKWGLGIQLLLLQFLRNVLIRQVDKMLNEVFGGKALHNLLSIFESKISRILKYQNIKNIKKL